MKAVVFGALWGVQVISTHPLDLELLLTGKAHDRSHVCQLPDVIQQLVFGAV